MAAAEDRVAMRAIGEMAQPGVAMDFDPVEERLVLICGMDDEHAPDVEIDEIEGGGRLTRLLVDGIQVALLRGPRSLVEDDFLLVDPALAARLGLVGAPL